MEIKKLEEKIGGKNWGKMRDLRLLPLDLRILGFSMGFLLLLSSPYCARAAIHEYSSGQFYPRSNSFFFHGGSEGLHASEVNVISSSSESEGKSFIRFESVIFRRTKESASKHHNMQQNTGLVEAIIVEIQDREKIGGTYFNSEAICCTPELHKEKFCKVGELRRSVAKLDLYRKLTNSLAVSVLISVAWIGYELYFNATDPLSELWQRAWIIPAFWNILSYILLAVICILWAPSQNPTRYVYSEDTSDDFDEEGISLAGCGAKGTGDMVNKLERKERKTTELVFGLGDDLEEDKRE